MENTTKFANKKKTETRKLMTNGKWNPTRETNLTIMMQFTFIPYLIKGDNLNLKFYTTHKN